MGPNPSGSLRWVGTRLTGGMDGGGVPYCRCEVDGSGGAAAARIEEEEEEVAPEETKRLPCDRRVVSLAPAGIRAANSEGEGEGTANCLRLLLLAGTGLEFIFVEANVLV